MSMTGKQWLADGKLRAETKVLIIAAQDGVIHTANYCSQMDLRPPAEREEGNLGAHTV